MSGQYYAYVHFRADTTPFYVGKGRLRRAKSVHARRSAHYHSVVGKDGAANIKVALYACSTEEVAFALEKGLIKRFRATGHTLVNQTDGGEGQSGRAKTPEEIAKWRAKNKGRKRSSEVCARISAARRGKAVSQETRDKLSAIFKGRPLPPAFAAKIRGERRGAKNPRAKAVVGEHPEVGIRRFDTLAEAALFIGGTTTKVSRALRRGYKHRGWSFRLPEDRL